MRVIGNIAYNRYVRVNMKEQKWMVVRMMRPSATTPVRIVVTECPNCGQKLMRGMTKCPWCEMPV